MAFSDKALTELSKIVDLFSKNEIAQVCETVYIKTAGKPSSKWSLSNQILMILSGTTDARGYRQWELVKRFVKKGSRAIYILAPTMVNKKEINEDTKEETIRPILVGFHGVPVFRIEDTDGEPLPVYQPKTPPPLLEVAERLGIKRINYEGTTRGEGGYFSQATDEITLCTENPAVYFHELAHKAHSMIEKLKGGQDPEQEAIAELSACVLSRLYGFNVDGNAWQYIASYAENKTPEAVGKLCMHVLAKVQKVLAIILEEPEKKKEEPIQVRS